MDDSKIQDLKTAEANEGITISADKDKNELCTIDMFISNFSFTEAEEVAELSNIKKLEKLLHLTDKKNNNLELYKQKKEEMRKKTRNKRKENKVIQRAEKYNMIKQMTEG